MVDSSKVDDVLELLFDTATDTRKFEIDLFWKRSLFFWGFIAAAFAGYAAVKENLLALVLACFGLVCSVVWTLGNRGSKYWQEAWEAKVERIEDALPRLTATANPVHPRRSTVPIQPLFRTREPTDTSKGWWLSGRQFSVSKLTIALSDFTSLVWLGLMLRSCVVVGHERLLWNWSYLEPARKWGWVAPPACSLVFLGLAIWKGQTTRQTPLLAVQVQPSHNLYGPVVSSLGVLALAVPWLGSWPFSPLAASMELTTGISVAFAAVCSALLWLHVALNDKDKMSNAAAAGFSGAAAFFGAGAVNIPPAMAASSPLIASYWAVSAYAAGWLVSIAVWVTTWGKWVLAKRGHNS